MIDQRNRYRALCVAYVGLQSILGVVAAIDMQRPLPLAFATVVAISAFIGFLAGRESKQEELREDYT